jgi:hypothetical protein
LLAPAVGSASESQQPAPGDAPLVAGAGGLWALAQESELFVDEDFPSPHLDD